ncbi:hypothetical protein BLOT_004385 [Blomia tropicalis]|nr:hypothetical protein BLOT_004385 [Blomia tropicalis]
MHREWKASKCPLMDPGYWGDIGHTCVRHCTPDLDLFNGDRSHCRRRHETESKLYNVNNCGLDSQMMNP